MKKLLTLVCFILIQQLSVAQTPPLGINWDKTIMVSKSVPALQVVTNPMLKK